MLKKKTLLTVFVTKCSKLCGLGSNDRRRKTFPTWNSSWGNNVFRALLYVWYLQTWVLCNGLVT